MFPHHTVDVCAVRERCLRRAVQEQCDMVTSSLSAGCKVTVPFCAVLSRNCKMPVC